MADVGVRAFKADVSGYLKRAAGGERVRVTSRGKALVELVPAAVDPAGVDASIERLRESGVVTPARSFARRMPTARVPTKGSGSIADDIVAERDRERLG